MTMHAVRIGMGKGVFLIVFLFFGVVSSMNGERGWAIKQDCVRALWASACNKHHVIARCAAIF